MQRRSALVILIGLLFVLLACKKDKSYPDGQDGLKQLMTDLSAASGEDQTKMADKLILPEPTKWFKATFGDELGGKLATDYMTDMTNIKGIGGFFLAAKGKNRTEVLIEKHTSADDENANGVQEAAMKAMKSAVPIYTVNMVEPGKTIGQSLWSFVYVDGAFRYVGKLKASKPDASPLDELSKKDLKDALGGSGSGSDSTGSGSGW